jgi:hypothetical protein
MIMNSSQHNQVFTQPREDFASAISHFDHILDADSAFALDIDARFNGHNHSRFEYFRLITPKARHFVDLETNSMSGGVVEVSVELSATEHSTCGLVHFARRNAGFRGFNAR